MSWSTTARGSKVEVLAQLRAPLHGGFVEYAPKPFVETLLAHVESMREPPENWAINVYTYGHVDPTGIGEAHFKIAYEDLPHRR